MSLYTSIAMVLLAVQGPLMAQSPQELVLPGELDAGADVPGISLPSELVAERVRDVLRDHRDSEAWKQLADALPEMALTGDADLGSTLEAGRLADSISTASLFITMRESMLTTMREAIRWRPSWWGKRVEAPPVVAVVLALVLVTALNWIWKGRSGRQSLKKREDPTEPAVKGRTDPWFVKSLADSGRPVHEIARQTKMAQDAILVLLELQANGTRRPVTHGGEAWPYKAPPAVKLAAHRSDPALRRVSASGALYTRYGRPSVVDNE